MNMVCKNFTINNFSGGIGGIPPEIIHKAKKAMDCLPETGTSIFDVSHRSDYFYKLIDDAKLLLKNLLSLSDEWEILFMQGGATFQFAILPFNFNFHHKTGYLQTGYWSKKAIEQVNAITNIDIIWNGDQFRYRILPEWDDILIKIKDKNYDYIHFVSNETVEGLQFNKFPPKLDIPIVCDMSSDFLTRNIKNIDNFSLIYAHTQKNLGIAGQSIVLIKKEMMDKANCNIPFFSYKEHKSANSVYNTQNILGFYIMKLFLEWIANDVGGLDILESITFQKSNIIYDVIDKSNGFYKPLVDSRNRSSVNVTFTLGSLEKDKNFILQAEKNGFIGINGHRSVNGIRISLYNAVTLDMAKQFADFMYQYFVEANQQHPLVTISGGV